MSRTTLQERSTSTLPIYNGFACIDDLRNPSWDRQVALLSQRHLGTLGIGGWTGHWSRVWEFPWAYEAICHCFAPQSNPELLESGCGVTPLPYWLGGDGFHVTGIDLDRSCEARWHAVDVPCRPESSATRFEYADMLNLPRGDATVDVVYSISAIEHTSDPVRAVSEMVRVLKPRGGLVVTMDVDICGSDSDSVGWGPFCEIVGILVKSTRPVLPTRYTISTRMLTFENRTLRPQSATRLLLKRILDHAGIRKRSDTTVFAWAGEKL
jgi:SAM-dependent methyltransferase